MYTCQTPWSGVRFKRRSNEVKQRSKEESDLLEFRIETEEGAAEFQIGSPNASAASACPHRERRQKCAISLKINTLEETRD